MHRDEMCQSLYYIANLVHVIEITDELIEDTNEMSNIDIPQATLIQLIQFVGRDNVKEVWSVSVGNSLKIKHYILLLYNRGYICTCLSIVQSGIICRHYFQVMLATKEAFFHIQFIPKRWYININKDGSQEPFLVADKFIQDDQQHFSYDFNDSSSLCLFNRNNREIDEERLTILEQKITYGKLHGMYKKALNKALQSNSKSEQLINLLQNFAEEEESNPSDSDELELQQEIITGDKENFDPSIPKLQNPKIRRGKGRPLGTKRFKSSCEANKTKSRTQRHCKRCGLAGHYQKNCKEEAVNN
ncbi:hypothetical protein RhiirA4_528674 [Rhizophagus irregularis]|uniref:SWIM-type domain-containing protein n=2 Tax=Rhizophagus irregularis TaxID=588596 RepID=A0A2I1FZP8_9GLOM|nr:hypothetical protein RhiirA4_528674 [Rhizophagus irregularis]